MTTNLDWTEIFARRPDLAPPGYEEACKAAKTVTEKRYRVNGKKRAKGTNARKQKIENRLKTAERERRAKFPSMKHGAQG